MRHWQCHTWSVHHGTQLAPVTHASYLDCCSCLCLNLLHAPCFTLCPRAGKHLLPGLSLAAAAAQVHPTLAVPRVKHCEQLAHVERMTKPISANCNHTMRAGRSMFSKLMSYHLTSREGVTSVPHVRWPTMEVKSNLCGAHACVGTHWLSPTPVQGASGWVASLL